MKKFVSMFLALVMALALAVPAFAQEEEFEIEGSITVPTINISMPNSGSIILNPYKLDVTLTRGEDPVQDQVVNAMMQVKNLSTVHMQVAIKVTGTTAGSVDLSSTSVSADTSGDPKAYVYGKFVIGDPDQTDEDVDLDVPDTITTVSAADGVVILTTDEQDLQGFGTAEADEGSEAATASNTLQRVDPENTREPNESGVLYFRFFGDTSDSTDWAETDTIGITVAFKFTPIGTDKISDYNA